jgi:hypothetical protein
MDTPRADLGGLNARQMRTVRAVVPVAQEPEEGAGLHGGAEVERDDDLGGVVGRPVEAVLRRVAFASTTRG